MRAFGRSRTSIVGIAILGVVLGASTLVPAGASTRSSTPRQSAGGTIRIAAEEELTCADWIASCAGSSWGNWSLGNLTLSQALNVDANGDYVPSTMLVDFPTLDPGPPMKLTYRIKPEAVWDDGQPITSKDFEYTWKQIVTGKDIYDPTGYVDIASVDTTDPKVAVVIFKKTFAGWRDLFGGFYYVLPSHLLAGKSRSKEMKDGYAFSAGPWKLEGGKKGWKKGKSLTFVPNDAYWGVKPSIAKVIFQFVPESSAELQAVKTGQVVAAYPLPIDGFLDQLDETPNLRYTVSQGNQTETFFINAAAFPLDSQAVRQAVAYATDRQAIVDQILKSAIREGRVLQSLVVPNFKTFFTPSFARYTPDQSMVDQLMTGDGWKKNGDGIWAKRGRTAAFTVNTTAGNKSRELSEQLWQSQLRQAGFDLKIKNLSSDVLFGDRMPRGRYAVVLAAGVGTPDPGQCLTYCSKNIPTKKKPSGQNWTRTKSTAIDEQWGIVETSLDDAARIAAAKLGQDALAEYVASLPLYQSPTTFIYDQSRLEGRLEDNTVMGPFFTMNEWVLK
jgi:peptide/nickel transport system substrate-binding protein